MSHVFETKQVKIRKGRRCFFCYRCFPVGTLMTMQSGIHEYQHYHIYTCDTCEEIKSKITDYDAVDDGYPEGYVHEMLEKGETSEQLLEELKNAKKNKIL